MRVTPWVEYGGIAAMAAVLSALVAAEAGGLGSIFGVFRALLGLVYLLLVPGYLLHLVLFPRRDHPDSIERVALSLGMSMAIFPPVALTLDALGLGFDTPVILVAYLGITVVLGILSWVRRQRIQVDVRFALTLGSSAGEEIERDRLNRWLTRLIVFALLLGVAAMIGILFLPSPAREFTEFYLIGEEGLAENFPRFVTIDEPITIIYNIINNERDAHQYRVEARSASSRILATTEPITIPIGGAVEDSLRITPDEIGDNVRIDIWLYQDNNPEPYRALRLWLNVSSST